ncbi:hypothetical protein MRB53_007505 [Persea americana]|uniref:Uncharacterized protein n=1 Tax=Persea americana TaxID=3435 RepID=A0ACC2MJ54_PERAE|nr:hypothetical protein MRB53_007505 [Persea americana]
MKPTKPNTALYLVFFLAFLGTKQMEGLIPFVYKAIKRNNTRRKYKCLSKGPAQSFQVAGFNTHVDSHAYLTPPPEKVHEGQMDHRQCKSVDHRFSSRYLSPVRKKEEACLSREAVGFRSHRNRSIFSCISGA